MPGGQLRTYVDGAVTAGGKALLHLTVETAAVLVAVVFHVTATCKAQPKLLL